MRRRALLADPRSFDEVVALVGERRDMKLKVHLEDHVSLVKFDAATGSIESSCCRARRRISPTSCARSSTPGRRASWVVVLSKAAGERPRGEVRREAKRPSSKP